MRWEAEADAVYACNASWRAGPRGGCGGRRACGRRESWDRLRRRPFSLGLPAASTLERLKLGEVLSGALQTGVQAGATTQETWAVDGRATMDSRPATTLSSSVRTAAQSCPSSARVQLPSASSKVQQATTEKERRESATVLPLPFFLNADDQL